MSDKIDATVAAEHAFLSESAHLIAKPSTAGGKSKAAVGSQDAMPGQLQFGRRFAQYATYQARTARQAGARRDLAITGHHAPRNGCERAADRSVPWRDSGWHWFDRRGTHRLLGYGRTPAGETPVQSFEQIRTHVGARHTLGTNDPYLISFDLSVSGGRHQGLYLAEMDDEDGSKYWEQRTGFLAVRDLAGSPYLHLCENRPYSLLSDREIDRVISELGTLGDRMERAISSGGDTL